MRKVVCEKGSAQDLPLWFGEAENFTLDPDFKTIVADGVTSAIADGGQKCLMVALQRSVDIATDREETVIRFLPEGRSPPTACHPA